jgi:glycosyltransferase involved in cell wall biosynthesis
MVVGLGVEEPPVYHERMKTAFLKECPDLENKPFLLFLSRIHEKKGIDLLLDAYASLLQDITKSELNTPHQETIPCNPFPKLVVAGPGIDSLFGQKLQELVAKNPDLMDNVYFPGMLSGDSKWGAFYSCEAFILPSHQENFGIAVVEALACSKPVIISDKVNIWREVSDSAAGLITEDCSHKILEVLEAWMNLGSSEKIAMGINAQNCYFGNFAVLAASERLHQSLVRES